MRLDDRLADAHYLLGLCLREQDADGRGAARRSNSAVALAPGLIPAREELADLYASLGRRADELEQLQVLAGLDRRSRRAAGRVGLAHAARRPRGSRRAHARQRARAHTRTSRSIYRALGQVWLESAPRDDPRVLSKALEALERVGVEPGATSESLTLYGRALLRGRRVEAAERTLQQATDALSDRAGGVPASTRRRPSGRTIWTPRGKR